MTVAPLEEVKCAGVWVGESGGKRVCEGWLKEVGAGSSKGGLGGVGE